VLITKTGEAGKELRLCQSAGTSAPKAINNRTQIVGEATGEAFLWQRGQLPMLPRLVSLTTGANDINDRRQIVGFSAAGEVA
jgi:uncharacterized membrane protein